MLHVRPRGQVTTVSSSQEGSPTSPKRERFLKRVVDQIEVDRLNRRLRSYLTTKYAAEASERHSLSKSMPGDVTDRGSDAVRSNDVISSSDALKSSSDDSDCNLDNKKRGSKLSLSLPPRSKQSFSPRPLGLNSHKRAESFSYATHTRLHKDKLKTFSKSQKDSSDSESQNSQRSEDVSKASLPSSRQVPLASSGPYYGHNKPPTPQKPPTRPNTPKATEPTEKNMFSWKICTPTNWKRGKSYHEILLEKKRLRRTGRLPSQSRFVSIFKPKDSRKPTAADRIRGVLKRAQFYGDDIKRLPLVRFRRAARTLVALLKTVKISKEKEKGMESALWFDDDEVRASKRAYEMFGVSFDAFAYRARREIQVSNEAKAILTMAPGTRSDEQRHVALVSLSQAVPEFGEFPRAMQEALVRVGWYECFEARRIIIREGHMADNFYLILSGSGKLPSCVDWMAEW
ncbi:hypothetical protein V1264_004162 [Littorina saxatilis]|uniref:Cyclic nucleotide-binding domain-containing protein n=1 Tax=Littorina saxatilis TaxID=31220 RepID=A0AAN9G6D0_9CAEN